MIHIDIDDGCQWSTRRDKLRRQTLLIRQVLGRIVKARDDRSELHVRIFIVFFRIFSFWLSGSQD